MKPYQRVSGDNHIFGFCAAQKFQQPRSSPEFAIISKVCVTVRLSICDADLGNAYQGSTVEIFDRIAGMALMKYIPIFIPKKEFSSFTQEKQSCTEACHVYGYICVPDAFGGTIPGIIEEIKAIKTVLGTGTPLKYNYGANQSTSFPWLAAGLLIGGWEKSANPTINCWANSTRSLMRLCYCKGEGVWFYAGYGLSCTSACSKKGYKCDVSAWNHYSDDERRATAAEAFDSMKIRCLPSKPNIYQPALDTNSLPPMIMGCENPSYSICSTGNMFTNRRRICTCQAPWKHCSPKNFHGETNPTCHHVLGTIYTHYTLMIRLMYYDVICCIEDQRKDPTACSRCEEWIINSFCEGSHHTQCDFRFILIEPTYGNRFEWNGRDNRNYGSAFRPYSTSDHAKESMAVYVRNKEVKIRLEVWELDNNNANDHILTDYFHVPAVSKCFRHKHRKFGNREWFKERNGKNKCNMVDYAISDKTRDYQMPLQIYKNAKHLKMYLRLIWDQTIIESKDAYK